jgi:hypothetical protein
MGLSVDCGYCGAVVVLTDDHAAPFAPCPECQWMVATGHAVAARFADPDETTEVMEPVVLPRHEADAEATAEPESSPLAFPLIYVPEAAPGGESREPQLPAEARVPLLAPPWADVRDGLHMARRANLFAITLLLAAVLVTLVIVPLVKERAGMYLTLFAAAWCLAVTLATIYHTGGQGLCALAPASNGGYAAVLAVGAMVLAGVGLGTLLLLDQWRAAAITFGLLALVSWGSWLAFLYWLGSSLRDRELASSAGWYIVLYWIGFFISAALGGGTYYLLSENSTTLAWVCQWASGLIALALAARYHMVLVIAADAIARRAPLKAGADS